MHAHTLTHSREKAKYKKANISFGFFGAACNIFGNAHLCLLMILCEDNILNAEF